MTIFEMLEHITNVIIHYVVSLPIITLLVWITVNFLFFIWLKIEDHYCIDLFYQLIHRKRLVRQASEVKKELEQCKRRKVFLDKRVKRINEREDELAIEEEILANKQAEFKKAKEEFERMSHRIQGQEENSLVERVCKVISKLPSSNYSKRMKPFISLYQNNMGDSYQINRHVRQILDDELKNSNDRKILLSIFDSASRLGHNSILLSWLIWSQFGASETAGPLA